MSDLNDTGMVGVGKICFLGSMTALTVHATTQIEMN